MIHMRTIITIVALLSIISCSNNKDSAKEICLAKILYNTNEGYLMPPSLKVDFIDGDSIIGNSIHKDELKNVFFYSIDSSKRKSFSLKYNYSERRGDTTTLLFSSNYFEFDKSKNWTNTEITNFLLKGNVGLIIGADTLIVTPCE